MKLRWHFQILAAAVLLNLLSLAGPVPIIYSTDLLHPHDDPDDHYDLATLFAISEFDIKGIVLDLGERQAQRCGKPALEQMFAITGRKVPWATGLTKPLKSRDDDARDQPDEAQGGVKLILSTLRESRDPVVVFTTGSCRDIAAAFNREPDLLRKKVRALYINIGRGPNEKQDEWNVKLDHPAYLRLFESGLPLFWCPCFGTNGYQTWFVVDQSKVIGACTSKVKNYFVYCLSKSKDQPVAFLETGPHEVPTGPRNMWCTAPMLHAAGRRIYERNPSDYVALTPERAREAQLLNKEINLFQFEPIRAELHGGPNDPFVQHNPANPNAWVFRTVNPRYSEIMTRCLTHLLASLGAHQQ